MNGLLTPVTIGELDLPNRLVMAPMTRSRARDGLVGELTAEYAVFPRRAGGHSFDPNPTREGAP